MPGRESAVLVLRTIRTGLLLLLAVLAYWADIPYPDPDLGQYFDDCVF